MEHLGSTSYAPYTFREVTIAQCSPHHRIVYEAKLNFFFSEGQNANTLHNSAGFPVKNIFIKEWKLMQTDIGLQIQHNIDVRIGN